jgi:hypothetical protein
MPDPSRNEVVAQIKRVVATAFWVGLTEEEIRAVFIAALLENKK